LSSKDIVLHCPLCLRERGELIYYAPRQKHCVVCQCEALEPLELAGNGQALRGLEEVLRDPAASFWLKDALRSALARDPVDAANDAEVLAQVLDRRCHSILASLDGARENSGSGGTHA
jgi:hypothetical protein